MYYKRIPILFSCIAFIHAAYAQPDERSLGKKKDTTKVVKGNTYAIIVGISDYKLVPDLQFAHKDAQSFESLLLGGAAGKIPKENIETFLNERATRDNVGDAISVIARKAKAGDRVFFFFAGHGDMEDLTQIENGLLLLYNSPNGNYFGMNDDVLEILDLKRYLSPLSQRGVEMLFVVDACHSGNLTGGIEGVKQTAAALMASWGKEYKILSCQPEELSLESLEFGGGRGLFSLHLEEGIKGLADTDGDREITMMELQKHLYDNVRKFSEKKQVPVTSGDMSKSFFTVDTVALAALMKQKGLSYPILGNIKIMGAEQKYIDSLDPAGQKIYASFTKNVAEKRLISPIDTNALRDYRDFEKKYTENPLLMIMRRSLATSLNDRFNNIVRPLLNDSTSYSSRAECRIAATELDSCLKLLGKEHYMYANLKARKLYMDAMALTWALTESEFNISLRPVVEQSIRLLEESEKLEPNAAYTVSALGIGYYYIYDYEKAFIKFQKYLDLRPNDFGSKYSLAMIYSKLKQYDKAEDLLLKLIDKKPELVILHSKLFEVYSSANKNKQALAYARKITTTVDSLTGLFLTGIYYAKAGNLDSAVYYYQLDKKFSGTGYFTDNNIGHIYFVHNKLDSARHYFNLSLATDSTNPFPHFNLASMDAIAGNYTKAVLGFARSIDYAPGFNDAFLTHMELYLGKHYTVKDEKLYQEFKAKSFQFDLKYLGYKSLLYCFIREPLLAAKKEAFDWILEHMFKIKDEDVWTWYHHACYKALNKDKEAALESLEKSLKLGFGNYFMLTSDDDLLFIRDTPEFKNLMIKYFPDKKK